jgi:hypothetical protein
MTMALPAGIKPSPMDTINVGTNPCKSFRTFVHHGDIYIFLLIYMRNG